MKLATRIILLILLIVSFFHGRVVYGQNIMPPAIAVDPLDMGAVDLPQEAGPVTVEITWHSAPVSQPDIYYTVIGYSFDVVTWQPLVILPYQTNGDVIVTSSNPFTLYRVGNIL